MDVVDDSKNTKMLRDEDCINFRSSPNLKYMKKYCKALPKENPGVLLSSASPESPTLALDDHQNSMTNQASSVQPPLPLNPPPPDSPLLTLKQEVEDDGYTNKEAEESLDSNQFEEQIKQKPNQVIDQKKLMHVSTTEARPKREMCKNFIRKTCTKGAACRFSHELDLAQLKNITFCHNFQNKGCKLPKCRFIHGTVFERENFLRTGELPPHAISHLKDSNTQPPCEDKPIEPIPLFTKPPPTLPIITCVPTSNLEARPAESSFRNVSSASNPLKREWSNLNEFNTSPREIDVNEPLVKKCKKCVNNEIREQINKREMTKYMRMSEEVSKKMAILSKKNERLSTVLQIFFTPMLTKSSGGNGVTPALNLNSDNEKQILEQVVSYMAANSANRGFSLIPEATNEKSLDTNTSESAESQFLTILAKCHLMLGDNSASPDGS